MSSDANQVMGWPVAAGIVSMILFPFLLPAVILTAVFAAPLLVPLLPLGIVMAVVLGIRRLRRRGSRERPSANRERPATESRQIARPRSHDLRQPRARGA